MKSSVHVPEVMYNNLIAGDADGESAKVTRRREEPSAATLRRTLLHPAAKQRPEPRGPNFGREIVPGFRVLQR